MSMLLAWIVFPAVLILLATGCGLLLRLVSGWELEGALVPATGLAVIMVVAGFLTMSDATAELAAPVTLGLAVAGFGLSPRRRSLALDRWALFAAAGVFAVFAAPVVLSGEATFAGYIKLDDTATWMAFTDRIMDHGRSVSGLAPSTYEATIALNLPEGYPVAAFLPLGVGREIIGQDLAWLVQPYMATMAATLALALTSITRPLVDDRRLRALVAFLAAQAALLFGYSLWGGMKEIAAALTIALLAALVTYAIDERAELRRLILPAVAGAALLGVLGAGGAVWLLTILLPAGLLAVRQAGLRPVLWRAAVLAGLLLLLSIPVLFASGTLFSPTQSELLSDTELGNLIDPLNGLQVVGIWPVGDFRLTPHDTPVTYALIAVAIAAAIVGLYAAYRARAWALVLYCGGAVLGCLVVVIAASPWVDGKALASTSPAVLLAAATGAAFLLRTDARAIGLVALPAIVAGVIWSNFLGYRNVNLAPREQLAELHNIGEEIAGQGPTLTTDSEVYGGRHFLRDSDPENSADLRRRTIPLVDGGLPDEVPGLDLDRLQLAGLLTYRTLVLQRSPSSSRPPSPYRLIDSGRFYDVWQRPEGSEGQVLEHLPLGDGGQPAATPSCGRVLDLARLARDSGPGGRLAAVAGRPVTIIGVGETVHPSSWESPEDEGSLYLTDSGDLSAEFSLPSAGDYTLWLGGSVRGRVDASLDGGEFGSVDHHLANAGEYTELGTQALGSGRHQLTLHYGAEPLGPGTDTPDELPYPTGPLALSGAADDPAVTHLPPDRARELCGRSWDWVEAVGG